LQTPPRGVTKTPAPKIAAAVPRVLRKAKDFRQEIGALAGASAFPRETRGAVADLACLLGCREEISGASAFKTLANKPRY
jgi:hypothetical protein